MVEVSCKNLSKRFGNIIAVNNVTMQIKQGEIYGLIGRNGAGKTTFLKVIAGLEFASEGKLEFFDKNRTEMEHIGCFIDGLGLYPNLSGRKNMMLLNLLYGGDNREVDRLIELVGIENVSKRKVSTYSLGMKQRLGLAISLMGNPSLIVLDEPFNGLDPLGVRQISDLIVELNKEYGKTFIISSHMLGELSRIATRVGFIDNGELKEEFEINEVGGPSDLEEYFLGRVGYEFV